MGEKATPLSEENSIDEFVINSETGLIISDCHEYSNIPEMHALIRRANVIRDNLPKLDKDHVRLWRGNRPNEVGRNPSFTNSLEGIALPFLDRYGGELSYVEIPATDLEKYIRSGSDAEFTLSAELAVTARTIEDPSRPTPISRSQGFIEEEKTETTSSSVPGWDKID